VLSLLFLAFAVPASRQKWAKKVPWWWSCGGPVPSWWTGGGRKNRPRWRWTRQRARFIFDA
jgi:hypothetical protein